MKVILKSDVENVGKAGQIIKVKRGFARNFLFPRHLAQEATQKRIKEFNHLLEVAQIKQNQLLKSKQSLLETISQTHLIIHVQTGQSDKLFGAITNADIASALEQKGLLVDRKQIHIESPIKTLGEHKIAIVLLGEGMKTSLMISVERGPQKAKAQIKK